MYNEHVKQKVSVDRLKCGYKQHSCKQSSLIVHLSWIRHEGILASLSLSMGILCSHQKENDDSLNPMNGKLPLDCSARAEWTTDHHHKE